MSDIRWTTIFKDDEAEVHHGHYQGELIVSCREDRKETYASYTFTNFAAELGDGVIRTEPMGEIQPLSCREALERIFDHWAHKNKGRPAEPFMAFHDADRKINWEVWNID